MVPTPGSPRRSSARGCWATRCLIAVSSSPMVACKLRSSWSPLRSSLARCPFRTFGSCCGLGWCCSESRLYRWAEHAAESLSKGSRVVVVGRLQQRAWTADDGSTRSVVEVVAEELGPSLRWATATPTTSGGQ
jgi:hypothetical protein